MNIVVVQPNIREYRKGIFSLLGNHQEVTSLTILIPDSSDVTYDGFSISPIEQFKLGSFVYLRGYRNILERADVVIAMFDIKWSCGLLWPLSSFRSKLILWGHGFGRSRNSTLAKQMRIFLARRAKALLFYDSKSCEEFMSKANLHSAKCFVAPNTMIVTGSAAAENYVSRKDFIFVGRLLGSKNIFQTVRAFLASNAPNCGSTFHIVGDGPEKEDIQEYIDGHKFGASVKLHGKIVDSILLKPLFEKSLAFLSSGQLGLAVVHSMAHGVPVVYHEKASHGPEINYLTNENSIVYDSSLESLTEEIENFVLHPARYLRCSKESYSTYLTHCSPKSMVAGIVAASKFTIK